jgi:predicted dehydrogenase
MAISLGVIGVGGMGGGHLRAAAGLPHEFGIVAVCDSNAAALAAAAQAHGATPYASFHDLCRHPGLDAALITLPHVLYRDATVAALEAGLHVFKEKPLGRDLADAGAIRDAARRVGRHVMVAGQSKFAPAFSTAKALVDGGAIGPVFLALGVITYRWGRAFAGHWGWRGVQAQSGGVAVIDSGWHVLDLLQWYRGLPERVYAVLGSLKAVPQGEYDVDDKAALTLEYPDGGIGSVAITFVAQPSERRIVLYGAEGTLDVGDGRLRHWRGDSVEEAPLAAGPDALSAQLLHFACCLRGEAAPIADIEHAYAVQRVVAAAYDSAHRGAPVLLAAQDARD